jgi:hypothetical protein
MRHETGYLACGAELAYGVVQEERPCHLCGRSLKTEVWCARGHFVCDLCHSSDPMEVIRELCRTTVETDMLRLMNAIRNHPCFAMPGLPPAWARLLPFCSAPTR